MCRLAVCQKMHLSVTSAFLAHDAVGGLSLFRNETNETKRAGVHFRCTFLEEFTLWDFVHFGSLVCWFHHALSSKSVERAN